MMLQATLAGIPGIVDLRFLMRSGLDGEWKGTFFGSVDGILDNRGALLETTLEEERRILPVTFTSGDRGLVSFRSDARSVPTDRPS